MVWRCAAVLKRKDVGDACLHGVGIVGALRGVILCERIEVFFFAFTAYADVLVRRIAVDENLHVARCLWPEHGVRQACVSSVVVVRVEIS